MVNLAAFLVFSAAGYGIRMSRADKKRAMGPQEKRKVSEMNMEEKQLKRARRHISQTQFIAYGFFLSDHDRSPSFDASDFQQGWAV